MRYRLFLYNTTARDEQAPCIWPIQRAIIGNDWSDGWDSFLLPFDTARIRAEIAATLGALCRAAVCFPPRRDAAYLAVTTTYDAAPQVVPELLKIAASNGLALFDAERDVCLYRALWDEAHHAIRLREEALRQRIFAENQPIYRYDMLSFREQEQWYCEIAVTLRKAPDADFSARTQQFYHTLSASLAEGERLECADRCFRVEGEGYVLIYCLEAYKKHADRIGFFENGSAQTALVRRMGCEEARRWMRGCTEEERDDIRARMGFCEMYDRYPNPADRFVASVRLAKRLRRPPWKVRCGSGSCGGWDFRMRSDAPDAAVILSTLSVGIDTASFLLPFIAQEYPDVFRREYSKNDLPSEMWRRIMQRMTDFRRRLLETPDDPSLLRELDGAYLHMLANGADEEALLQSDPQRFLCRRRAEIAALLELFLAWMDAQLQNTGVGDIICFEGP